MSGNEPKKSQRRKEVRQGCGSAHSGTWPFNCLGNGVCRPRTAAAEREIKLARVDRREDIRGPGGRSGVISPHRHGRGPLGRDGGCVGDAVFIQAWRSKHRVLAEAEAACSHRRIRSCSLSRCCLPRLSV